MYLSALNLRESSLISGASLIAAGGLATNTNVFIVASMLVSPIMGPILGVRF